MRIIAGEWGGRTIEAPKGRTVRPTSDRAREAWMSIVHPLLPGARVLDLCAGTGALGLEALSRGARHCLFVEEGAEARGLIRTNVEALGLTGHTRLWRRDATKLGTRAPMEPFDLAFLDPPYGKGLAEAALAAMLAGDWMKPGAVVVVEETIETEVAVPAGFTEVDRRDQGDSRVIYLTRDV